MLRSKGTKPNLDAIPHLLSYIANLETLLQILTGNSPKLLDVSKVGIPSSREPPATSLDYWKAKADEAALREGKPRRVVQGPQGEYSIFPAGLPVSKGFKSLYVTGGLMNQKTVRSPPIA